MTRVHTAEDRTIIWLWPVGWRNLVSLQNLCSEAVGSTNQGIRVYRYQQEVGTLGPNLAPCVFSLLISSVLRLLTSCVLGLLISCVLSLLAPCVLSLLALSWVCLLCVEKASPRFSSCLPQAKDMHLCWKVPSEQLPVVCDSRVEGF